MDLKTIQTSKKPRHIVARELVNEYYELTKTKPDWPRTNQQLAELTDRIAILRRKKKINPEIQQGGYIIDEAFSGSDKYIKFIPRGKHYNHFVVGDLIKIFNSIIPTVLLERPLLKINVTYDLDMYLASNPDIIITVPLRAEPQIILRSTHLEEAAKDFFAVISRQYEVFTSLKTGLVFKKINFIQLSIHDFKPTTGASYKPLPKRIQATKSCINVKNDDNKCLLWALLSAVSPAHDNADRVNKYKPYQCRINMTGIDYPAPVKQIPKIEQQNPTLFRSGINVFSLDDKLRVFPYLISPASKHITDGSTVNLLWYNEHYVWIKDLSRLMSSKMSGYDHKMFFCYSCLCGFRTQQELNEHNKYCFEVKAVTTPKIPDNLCFFKKHERTKKLPFIFVGDFESFVVPVSAKCCCGKTVCECQFKTLSTHKHVPASYQINTICTNDRYSKLSPIYRLENDSDLPAEVHMLKYLFEQQRNIEALLSLHDDRFTRLDSFVMGKQCFRCKKEFTVDNPKVPFYDITTDEYIGTVHKRCRSFQQFYPVVFHNLRGYDGHFIINALAHPEISKYCNDNHISLKCIPSSTEKLMSITVGKLRFIDSYQFMNTSLEQLARNCTSFPITEKYFKREMLEYITVKGIFPYEYFNSVKRFSETSLPSIDKFYSSLTDKDITEQEYQRALTTWDVFKCKNFGDYHDIYLTVDVLLLSDIFEGFRTMSMSNYELDPAHYYSAPGLSWDALLKSTKIRLELLTDVNMYLFIEKAIRGGISVITKKHSIANNKYLKQHDINQPNCYIGYWDMNNLYGGGMSMLMPYGGFKWVSTEDFLAAASNWKPGDDLSTVIFHNDEKIGYYVECDIDYPEHLHDAHNDYPFLVEKMIVTDVMLSPEQLALRTTKYTPITKLIPNLYNKRNYVCHISLLKQAIEAGLILRNVHKVLQFNHSTWMKSYIDLNTARRAAAKNDFERDFFKLMINSVFGKTMENIRKRVNIEIVNNKARRDKLVRGNRFAGIKKITNHLSLITLKQSRLHLDKPVYVGAAVLEMSKYMMYQFHYGFVKKKWPDARLLFTDTDSLVYEIPSDDIYEDIYDHRELFDLSNIDINGIQERFHDNTNKKVIGKMKDEFEFLPIKEFVGLRSKMYSVLTDSDSVSANKAKGINKNYVKNKLKFTDYLTALLRPPGEHLPTVTTYGFRSYYHTVFTDRITKSGVCNFDNKRYCRDGINTFAHGHYSIGK